VGQELTAATSIDLDYFVPRQTPIEFGLRSEKQPVLIKEWQDFMIPDGVAKRRRKARLS
jgi:hypothetical protein